MEKIGFIGLGIMGKPMALHLLKAGYSISVLQKNKASGELVNGGASSYATAKEIAERIKRARHEGHEAQYSRDWPAANRATGNWQLLCISRHGGTP